MERPPKRLDAIHERHALDRSVIEEQEESKVGGFGKSERLSNEASALRRQAAAESPDLADGMVDAELSEVIRSPGHQVARGLVSMLRLS